MSNSTRLTQPGDEVMSCQAAPKHPEARKDTPPQRDSRQKRGFHLRKHARLQQHIHLHRHIRPAQRTDSLAQERFDLAGKQAFPHRRRCQPQPHRRRRPRPSQPARAAMLSACLPDRSSPRASFRIFRRTSRLKTPRRCNLDTIKHSLSKPRRQRRRAYLSRHHLNDDLASVCAIATNTRPQCTQLNSVKRPTARRPPRNKSPTPPTRRATRRSPRPTRTTHHAASPGKRKIAQRGVVRHRRQRRKPDAALADGRMAILARAERVLRVVQMNRPKTVQADHPVELLQHAVKIAGDIVSSVPYVARVQAHAHPIAQLNALDDGGYLLEGAPDLGALTRHRLQQKRRRLIGAQHLVQRVGDLLTATPNPAPRGIPDACCTAVPACFPCEAGRRPAPQANSARLGLGRRGVERVGAWARNTSMPARSANSENASTSAGSMAFALPPRGLRVKNWNVFASIEAASSAIFR